MENDSLFSRNSQNEANETGYLCCIRLRLPGAEGGHATASGSQKPSFD